MAVAFKFPYGRLRAFILITFFNPVRSHATPRRIEAFGRTSKSRTSKTQADTIEVFCLVLCEVVAVI